MLLSFILIFPLFLLVSLVRRLYLHWKYIKASPREEKRTHIFTREIECIGEGNRQQCFVSTDKTFRHTWDNIFFLLRSLLFIFLCVCEEGSEGYEERERKRRLENVYIHVWNLIKMWKSYYYMVRKNSCKAVRGEREREWERWWWSEREEKRIEQYNSE